MRICLLTDRYVGSSSSLAAVDAPCDPRPYLPEAEWTEVPLTKATAVRRIETLSREGFDLFFNLCDGARDEDRPGVEVAQTLERLGLPFTGASSEFWEPSREAMKRVCRACGIGTPRYRTVRTEVEVTEAAAALSFPLIVKHPNSYSSIGITPDSRVTNVRALRREVDRMIEAFGGALVEEFVEGREFTVLVAENPEDAHHPTTYKPVEFHFPTGETFKHFDLKWVDYGGLRAVPCADEDLEASLRDAAAQMFVGLNGAGYGRCDIRVDSSGGIKMLEINPNCGLYYPPEDPGSADIILMNDPAGHAGFTRQVVAAALARWRRARSPWRVAERAGLGYGIVVNRDIRAGETIISYEVTSHVLVSRRHVERHWDVLRRDWFERYAWPVGDEVYAVWDRSPEDWKPINHACDPSGWLEGLDVVARRDISAEEEVTLDYATFCNELMPDFECDCGAPCCRGTIRGTDYLEPFVARYGTHLSDYVRRHREARAGFGTA